MPSFCVVSNCELKYTHSENVSFHKFPLHDEALLETWIKFTDRGSDWKPSRWSSICSRHFTNDDFREFLSRKCLKKNAIPSVVTKNTISFETYHIAEQSSTANSQYGDEDVSVCTDDKETDATAEMHQNEHGKMCTISCRLCGDRIDEGVKASSRIRIDDPETDEMLRKCLPSINVSRPGAEHSNVICQGCGSQLRQFSHFVDKVLVYQRDIDGPHVAESSLQYETQVSNISSSANSAPFIKQEPINVKQEILDISNRKPPETLTATKPTFISPTSTICAVPTTSDQRVNVVEKPFIQWPRSSVNTFCRLCERIFTSNAEMKSHTCTGSPQLNADRVENANGANSNNNCEIMEIITLNNPVSFIDLAEDEYAMNEQITVCKKEIVIDVDRRERVDIEHAYARRTTASSNCKLKQEIEINFDYERTEGTMFNLETINNATVVLPASPPAASVHSVSDCRFICLKCGQEFSTNRLLIDHSNKMHSLKNRICVICSAEFKSTYEYLLHKNRAHVSGYRCRQCKRKFTTSLALKNHERHTCSIDSMDYYYSCRHCGKFMRNRLNMKEHLRICGQSRTKEAENSSLERVICSEATAKKPFSCTRCHRSFRKEVNLKRHLDKKCENNNSEGSCNNDPNGPHTETKYDKAISAGTESNHMEVDIEANAIDTHSVPAINTIRNNNIIRSPNGKYVCELCSKPFQAYANLKQHRTTHENEKKFICAMCPKKFKRISGLNQHIRGFHYKIKPFSCPVCSYSYALKGDMLRCRHSSLKYIAAHPENN